MQLEKFEMLEQAVSEADMVLVGLGEEWVLTEEAIRKDLEHKNKLLYEMYSVAIKDEAYRETVPLLTAYYYKNFIPETLQEAYKNMLQMLEGKNYFVVSLSLDSFLKKCGFREDRCVNPCGTYEKIQCKEGCNREVESSEHILGKMREIITIDCGGQDEKRCLDKVLNLWNEYHCERCGVGISFNLLDSKKYLEEGYLAQWQLYMKWLQGTLNKKLVVIEAGVGMKLPSVIRWPFEKTVYYNQKSKMFRIHKKYYQVNEEIADRAYGCKCDSVHLFSEKKMEA